MAAALDSGRLRSRRGEQHTGQGRLGAGLLLQRFSAVSASSVLIRGNHFHNNSTTNPQASGGAVRWQLLFQRTETFDGTITLEDNVMIGSSFPSGSAASL